MKANGTAYSDRTPVAVINVLEGIRLCAYTNVRRRQRLKIWYGDRDTGEAWGDIETGYIGRSVGPVKVPLICHNSRSFGGPSLLDDCIVRIDYANRRDGGTLYRHPSFYIPKGVAA